MNDGIVPDLCSMYTYISIVDAAEAVRAAGTGSFLAKVDIKHTYRMVPVHPEDRILLGMAWEGALFADTACHLGCVQHPRFLRQLWML